MLVLNLPEFNPKIKRADRLFIWDRIRKKYVALTPEEWVRQHFVNYMITEKLYPESLIANEMQIVLNGQKRRCDSVIYDSRLKPLVIVEYKSPEVRLTQDVFDQIVRYNIVLKVKYLIVSNGIQHYCCHIDYEKSTYDFIDDIPEYGSL